MTIRPPLPSSQVRSLSLLVSLVLCAFAMWPAVAAAQELRRDAELPEGMEKYLEKEDLDDGKATRNRGSPNMCVFECSKSVMACTSACKVEKVERNDPKMKKVVGRKQSEGEKCVAKCGETQNKCMATCKK